MLEMPSRFDAFVEAIGSSPEEQTDWETSEALSIVKDKIRRTIHEHKKGNLLSVCDRLELLTPEEQEILKKRLPLESEPLIKSDSVQTYRSPIFERIEDPAFVGVWKFILQPETENPTLILVAIESESRMDFAVGLATQEELDLLAEDLTYDEKRSADFYAWQEGQLAKNS